MAPFQSVLSLPSTRLMSFFYVSTGRRSTNTRRAQSYEEHQLFDLLLSSCKQIIFQRFVWNKYSLEPTICTLPYTVFRFGTDPSCDFTKSEWKAKVHFGLPLTLSQTSRIFIHLSASGLLCFRVLILLLDMRSNTSWSTREHIVRKCTQKCARLHTDTHTHTHSWPWVSHPLLHLTLEGFRGSGRKAQPSGCDVPGREPTKY